MKMSGGGGGGGSGRAHFRSSAGCCICGTKSSSSRFTNSYRYVDHFMPCFGAAAAQRQGDLCNACVLCVKRWLQRGKQFGLFVQVVDSKRGPGPKHMKEITKRARRREARVATQSTLTSVQKINGSSVTSSTAAAADTNDLLELGPPACGYRQQQPLVCPQHQQPQKQQTSYHLQHQQSGACCVACWAASRALPQSKLPAESFQTSGCSLMLGHVSSFVEGATMTRAAVARQLKAESAHAAAAAASETQVSDASNTNSLIASTPSRKSTVMSAVGVAGGRCSDIHSSAQMLYCNTRRCSGNTWCCASGRSNGSICKAGYGESSSSSGFSDLWSASDDGNHIDFPSLMEFRPPPPPTTTRMTRTAAAAAAALSSLTGCDALSTASSTPPSTPRRCNRRVQLRPIKMTDSDEVNALLRQIMETNSQAVNFDSREMHMAVQRKLRLRNRTVSAVTKTVPGSPGSTSLSSVCCSSSLGSFVSEVSAVENGLAESGSQSTSREVASTAHAATIFQRNRRS